MFRAEGENTGFVIAEGTNTREVARALASLAGIPDKIIWGLPDDDSLRERVVICRPITLKRIRRHPDPEIDFGIKVGRVYDVVTKGSRTAWRRTDKYIVRVNTGVGIDLTSFENIDEQLERSARNSIPGRLRLLLGRFHITVDAASGKRPP